jgi:hypothetical protein
MNLGVRTPARAWAAALVGGVLGVAAATARAGHESPFYPSFYPQEIRIETLDPAAARAGWGKARVHAYLGADPFSGVTPPAEAASVQHLHSFVVLTFDGASSQPRSADGGGTDWCANAGRVIGALARDTGDFVVHPYPVTPYHSDYLQHFDLAQQARARVGGGAADGAGAALRIRSRGEFAQSLIPARWKAPASAWDATLEEIELDRLVGAERAAAGGWSTAPWARQGWYQAHRLLAGHLPDGARRAAGETASRRLLSGDYGGPTQRINLERSLVSTLRAGCERMVVGYRLRGERYNSEYSIGAENVAFDSQSGFDSAVFARTVKLKDFIWNGWLRLGIAARPAAAWNPLGGMNDGFGRMLWHAVGDPALLPAPHGGRDIANRVSVGRSPSAGAVAIPPDALMPQPSSGELRPVGAGRNAQRHIRYFAVLSSFHHGARGGVADIVYPYIFAFRWAVDPTGSAAHDPSVARSTALVRQWLAGFKVVRVEEQARNYGADLKFSYQVPVVDVYLNHRLGDPWQRSRADLWGGALNPDLRSAEPGEEASIAPPWSTLPWEVVVLMEEAVRRGVAAFSEAEARRRRVPWLDLVRDRETGRRLAALVESFGREAYRPAALSELVTADEARERWAALARFHAQHGHFLVTNGPYRLKSWSANTAVLEVFRDLSYPVGLGTFDDLAFPLKAYISRIENRGARLELRAEVDRVSRFARSYDVLRVALGAASREADERDRLECRYVIVGPDGRVVRAGVEALNKAGRFVVDLGKLAAPGRYQVITALVLGGNSVNPEVRVFEHRAAGG